MMLFPLQQPTGSIIDTLLHDKGRGVDLQYLRFDSGYLEPGSNGENDIARIVNVAILAVTALPFVNGYAATHAGDHLPDLIAFDTVVVDAKVIEGITDHERGQMLNYLRITKHKVGVILNFKRRN